MLFQEQDMKQFTDRIRHLEGLVGVTVELLDQCRSALQWYAPKETAGLIERLDKTIPEPATIAGETDKT